MTEECLVSPPTKGALKTKVGSQSRLFELSHDNTMAGIKPKSLQNLVSGFLPGKRTMLKVDYFGRVMTYHLYDGGVSWIPTVPEDVAEVGDVLNVGVEVLTVPEFVHGLAVIRFANDMGADWLAETSQLANYTLKGNQLTMHFVQERLFDEGDPFDVTGTVEGPIGWGSVSGSYLDIRVSDIFDEQKTLRLYSDGYNSPSIGIRTGKKFGRVHMISYDGVRLAIGYEKACGHFHVAYLYTASPASLYRLGEIRKCSLDYAVKGYGSCWKIERVIPQRDLEHAIAIGGRAKSNIGRIGAEIAYTVATEKLGLVDVVLQDPSQPGPDLYTKDGLVLIEARLLQRTQQEGAAEFADDIRIQLNQMTRKLGRDLKSRTAVMGYAIISYIDHQRSIRTIALSVRVSEESG